MRWRSNILSSGRVPKVRLTLPLLMLFLLLSSQAALAAPSHLKVRSSDGVEIAVIEEGDRQLPGILFIHGFGQSQLSFRRQFGPELAQRFHLVAFDLRGHGGSSKPADPVAYSDITRSADDVAAVIKATGLVRPVIVAWSYGGLVAADYVRKFGVSDVAGLVFAGTLAGLTKVAGPLPDEMAEIALQMRSASELTRSSDLANNIEGARIISEGYATPTSTAEDRRILLATELMLPAYVRNAMMQRRVDNYDLVGQLAAVPMLLVRGETEMGMSEPGIADLRRQLPQLKVSRYPGGHRTFFDFADRFNGELARFVDTAASQFRDGAALPKKTSGLPLTLAGHRAFRDREFAMVDRNSDGAIDHDELRFRMEAAVGRSSPEALARAMRVNCGRDVPACSRAAFRVQGDAEFARVDNDHDGTVTETEFFAAGSTFHLEQPF